MMTFIRAVCPNPLSRDGGGLVRTFIRASCWEDCTQLYTIVHVLDTCHKFRPTGTESGFIDLPSSR